MGYPTFALGDKWEPTDANAVGLWLVKTQVITGTPTTVTVTGAFSADYDNYLITLNGGSMSVDGNISLSLGSAGTGYFGSLIFGNYAAATVTAANDNNSAQWSYSGGGTGATCFIQLLNPFLSTSTECIARVRYSTVYGTYVGHRGDTTSFTSFSLNGSGTFTGGTIRVYGYRK
jgi:hypothetical protein